MIAAQELGALVGRTVHGPGGERVGRIVDVYEAADDAAGTFVTVSTGLFGSSASFVPLADATLAGRDVVVPYSRSMVKDAPRIETDEELTPEEEDRLYQHYSAVRRAREDTVLPAEQPAEQPTVVGEQDDDAMTRSQERLHVGTERVQAGRARLRKRIVTETQTRAVPLGHEEVAVERHPDGGLAPAGAVLGEAAYEVVVSRQTPVVGKETVEVERVRVGVHEVNDQATVTEHVRKENIELVEDRTSPRDAR